MFLVEEKYGKASVPSRPRGRDAGDIRDDSEDDESSSEEEDDEAVLATEALDAQISATLQAIRSKDPRVYDEKTTFYTQDMDDEDDTNGIKQEKPMFLKDYHRQNLLAGHVDVGAEEDVPKTYMQEQDELKRDVVKEMHAAAENGMTSTSGNEDDESDGDGGFLVPKSKPQVPDAGTERPRRPELPLEEAVAKADRDPESFLSNFMASRAWVPTSNSRFQPFDSDDEEEEVRADAFEQAYNLRFEDPKGANEKLMVYARDATAKHSVRREELSGRKKQRETLRERKEEEARQRTEEKARLRKLKVEEAEERVQRIKEAAGLKGKVIAVEEWADLLGGDWDDDKWEQEMEKRFGDAYYAAGEGDSDDDSNHASKRKVKKPKWNDDIDIQDLVPEFDDAEAVKPPFALSSSSDDAQDPAHDSSDEDDEEPGPTPRRSKKDRIEARRQQKKVARLERQQIEEFVDDRLEPDILRSSSSKNPSRFRYRDTSPTTYGLTPRDILLASDQQLNEYAGLKKLAAFRDAEKKPKDKKRLGKKARLRQWRKETFGHEDGPRVVFNEDRLPENGLGSLGKGGEGQSDGASEKKKTKKRSRKGKGKAVD